MIQEIKREMEAAKADMLEFERKLVQIESYTGKEEAASKLICAKMKELGYDEVVIDPYGSVLGRVGDGDTEILFDAHIDVVAAEDAEEWEHGPFSGDVEDGIVWGRGTVDTKSSAVAMVYAGYLMKKLNLLEGKKVYISTSVMEEDFDGELLDRVMTGNNLHPSFAVIGEPSNMKLALGHRGRAMYVIRTKGISAHGSAPETGENAVYKMAELITRVDKLNQKLSAQEGEKGSVALTRIESRSASLNAVPDGCAIYLDRRLALGEDEMKVAAEMDELVAGTDAQWEIYDAKGTSWTGKPVVLRTFLPAWEAKKDEPLAQAGIRAYREIMGRDPELFKWDFATNGFACAGRYHVPTIGLGPGDYVFAHQKNERCKVEDIENACMFYVGLVANL